jgi:hypothetical protein
MGVMAMQNDRNKGCYNMFTSTEEDAKLHEVSKLCRVVFQG